MPSSSLDTFSTSATETGVAIVAGAVIAVLCIHQLLAFVTNLVFRAKLARASDKLQDPKAGEETDALETDIKHKCSIAWRTFHYYSQNDKRLAQAQEAAQATTEGTVSPLISLKRRLQFMNTMATNHQPVKAKVSRVPKGFELSGHKQLLYNATGIVNPGELVAIMGPSGCGKTTLLDCLSGRRKTGVQTGSRYCNGVPYTTSDQTSAKGVYANSWLLQNSGYVRQFDAPYVSNLTVVENLAYSAELRIRDKDDDGNLLTFDDKFKRVRMVLNLADLHRRADVVVDKTGGGGLSGGQKRRLAVAIELLASPYVLFMDEPTSGLDGASSLQMVVMLRNIATNQHKAIMLTIHQPRIEIFNLFDRLSLMVNGATVYFGAPTVAVSTFTKCALDCQLTVFDKDSSGDVTSDELAQLLATTNPADLISDVLQAAKDDQVCFNYLCELFDTNVRWRLEAAIDTALPMAPLEPGPVTPESSTINRTTMLEGRFLADSSWASILLPIAVSIFSALLFGTLFRDDNANGQILTAALYKAMLAAPLYAPVVTSSVTRMLSVVQIETEIQVIDWWQYLFSTISHFCVFGGLSAIVMYLIIYVITFENFEMNDVITGCLFTWQFNLTHMSISLIICLVVTQQLHLDGAIAVWGVGVAESMMQLFSGFFKPYKIAHIGYQIVYCMNPEFWFFSAMTRINLSSQSRTCPPKQASPLENTTLVNDFAFISNITRVNATFVDYEAKQTAHIECQNFGPESFMETYGYNNVKPYFHLLVLLGMNVLFLAACLIVATAPWRPHGILGKERKFFPGATDLDKKMGDLRAKHGQSNNAYHMFLPGAERLDRTPQFKSIVKKINTLNKLSNAALTAKRAEVLVLAEWESEKKHLQEALLGGHREVEEKEILERVQSATAMMADSPDGKSMAPRRVTPDSGEMA
ncbi:ABC transporter [Pycnococcus provasolii]